MNAKTLIIDYGLGNIMSLSRALEHVGSNVIISNNIKKINEASHIILLGVGAYKEGMRLLREKNLDELIYTALEKKKNFLGICLGMQLLLNKSYENGENKGLGVIDGEVKPIKSYKDKFKIKSPNIGWYNLEKVSQKKNFNIFQNIKDTDNFYFVHSFYCDVKKNSEKIFLIKYANKRIPAIISKDNIFGFQFHPEKSGESGLKLLKNFINLK